MKVLENVFSYKTFCTVVCLAVLCSFFASPLSSFADSRDRTPTCHRVNDRDCDGFEAPPDPRRPCLRGGGGDCRGDYDLDDNDPRVGDCRVERCG